MSVERMMGERHSGLSAEARFDAMFRLRHLRLPNGKHLMSYQAIGRVFDRDHSTVISAIKKWRSIAALRGLPTVDGDLAGRAFHLEEAERLTKLAQMHLERAAQIERDMSPATVVAVGEWGRAA
jgi:hypothetical protein